MPKPRRAPLRRQPFFIDAKLATLLLHRTSNACSSVNNNSSLDSGGDTKFNITYIMEVLTEQPGTLDVSVFTSKLKYEYLYCGSSLFGNLNPQRIREWIAYHVKFFGPSSHFVIHDVGGVHEKVLEVLKPWIELV